MFFSAFKENMRHMKATDSKVDEISQVRMLFFHDDLHNFTLYGMIQNQIGLCQVQLLRFLFVLHKQFTHSLHLTWRASR